MWDAVAADAYSVWQTYETALLARDAELADRFRHEAARRRYTYQLAVDSAADSRRSVMLASSLQAMERFALTQFLHADGTRW